MNIFDLKKEYLEIISLTESLDSDDNFQVEAREKLNELNDTIEQKLNSLQDLKLELKSEVNCIDEKIKLLQEKAKVRKNKINHLTNLQDFLLNGKKLSGDEYSFYYKKTEKINIIDEDKIPDEYKTFSISIKKQKIKDDINQGVIVDGVEIIKNNNLIVR